MANLISDIIVESFLDLAVIQPGDGALISASIQADAFMRYKQMLDAFSAERGLNSIQYHQSFNLTAGTDRYTLGVGASLNASAKPVRATAWSSVSGTFENSGRFISFDEMADKVNPTGRTSILAEAVAVDNASPMNVQVWPPPATSPGSLVIDYWAAFAVPSAVSDTVNYSVAVENMLHWNLALQLYANYAGNRVPLEFVAAMAKSSKDTVLSLNGDINGQHEQAAA